MTYNSSLNGTQKPVYLITGGCGAIGSAVARKIIADDHGSVYVVDDLSAGFHNQTPGVEFVHCDISNKEKIRRHIQAIAPDFILHLAAHFANQNSVEYPISDAMTNIIGTINILEAVRGLRSAKKLVYSSSSCVYGNSQDMHEDARLNDFETPYAISKYSAELYVRFYALHHGLPSVSIRVFNTYGPGEMPGPYRNVIPNFIVDALEGKPLVITGSGDETRDFTYVDDTAALLLTAAHSPCLSGEVFNGGTGRKTSIRQLAETIQRLTQSRSELRFRPRRDWDGVLARVSDVRLVTQKLGYRPNVELEEGLRRTISWISQNSPALRGLSSGLPAGSE
jgi:nucleoside-diphosphate-sugar epimerase